MPLDLNIDRVFIGNRYTISMPPLEYTHLHPVPKATFFSRIAGKEKPNVVGQMEIQRMLIRFESSLSWDSDFAL